MTEQSWSVERRAGVGEQVISEEVPEGCMSLYRRRESHAKGFGEVQAETQREPESQIGAIDDEIAYG